MYAKAGAIWLQKHLDDAQMNAAELSETLASVTKEKIAQSTISQYLSEKRTISEKKVLLLTKFFFVRRHSLGGRLDEFFEFPSPTDGALLVLFRSASICLAEVVRTHETGTSVGEFHAIALFSMQGARWLNIKKNLESHRNRAAELAVEVVKEIKTLAAKLGVSCPPGHLGLDELLKIETRLGKYWIDIHRCLTEEGLS